MDKYAKVRKIGEGAFGKADLVKRRDTGSQYVIKQINISRMGAKEREDSRKEVSVLAQLQHPNIVAYKESFEELGNLYIVMDYCSGGDLYARINNQRGVLFTEDQILDWFAQMCLAIKHIHDRKILHRDIKSQNIFLTDRGLVQLGDFGIAKVLNSTVELARTCIGTPYYLSPEICENKPYNNKSDIWSLGCVIYEVSTLKHAFEAGNMKNLVLKIIRGSYPPMSPRYSYELRNLVAQLFKRAPRDRPSINSVLKKPLISQRVPKFLSSEQLASEFSHTVMHGQKLGRALPPPPKPAARPPSAAAGSRAQPMAAAAAAKKYDPSKIYGQPVVRKSNNRASADLKKRPGSAGSRPGSAAGSRPGSAAGSRPGSAAGNRPGSAGDLAKRRQELAQKEQKRRDEEKKKAEEKRRQEYARRHKELQDKQKEKNKKAEEKRRQEYARRHKELQDKQKNARMAKAREEGWNNLIGSLDSNSSGDGRGKNGAPVELGRPAPKPAPRPSPRPNLNAGGDYNRNAVPGQGDRGKYEHYNQYLDQLQQGRDVRARQDNVPAPAPAANYMAAPRAAPQPAPQWRRAPDPTPVNYQPHNQRGNNQQQERAKLVDDFVRRREEAAHNRQRGQAELFGRATPQQRPPSAGNQYRPGAGAQERPQSAGNSRDREEQEYLERLRQIRQQNYNERRNLQAKMAADKNPQQAAEERKKKADALKKQAEDWAKQRKDMLEQKRQDLFDKERQLKEVRQNIARPAVPQRQQGPAVAMTGAVNAIGVSPQLVPAPAPAPKAPAMTGILGAIGATPQVVPTAAPAPKAPAMTGILGAIGATPQVVEDESRPKTPMQKQKEEILRKLNEKGPPGESDERPESARSKWGARGNLQVAEQTQEVEAAERPKWGGAAGGGDIQIAEQEPERPQWERGPAIDLGNMGLEETASQMEVTSARDRVIMNPASARRQWGSPGSTVLNALQGAALSETTTTTTSTASDDSITSPPASGSAVQAAAGATITISKSPIKKGTIVIHKAEDNQPQETKPQLTEPPVEPQQQTTNQNTAENISTNQNAESKPAGAPFECSTIPEVTETNPLDTQVKTGKESVSPQKPPVPAKKPPLPDRPIVLPKPVLLPKPDKPKECAPSQPVSIKSQGAGSLFEKVDLDPEEKEDKAANSKSDTQTAKPEQQVVVREMEEEEKPKSRKGMALGLTMGSFDAPHRELLRTCSEPDLASLFRTLQSSPTAAVRVRSLEDMSAVDEEEDDMEAMYSGMEDALETAEKDELAGGDGDGHKLDGTEHGDQQQEEEGEPDEEDEDIADLLSVRETMQSLLLDDSAEEDSKRSPIKFSLSSDRESRGDTNDGDVEDTEEEDSTPQGGDDEDEGSGDDDDDVNDEDEADGLGDDLEDQDDDEMGEGEGDETDEAAMFRSHSVDNENPQTPEECRDAISELFQTDDDSDDSEFNDGEDVADFDLFGRLEESRAELETELGAEKLIKVYKTVQALQEDEDENMEEGARIAQELLGEEKQHLYPKIFQLVMADAAFTDDNLS